jgi:hypothetical protein
LACSASLRANRLPDHRGELRTFAILRGRRAFFCEATSEWVGW